GHQNDRRLTLNESRALGRRTGFQHVPGCLAVLFGVAANQVTTLSTFTVRITRRTSFNYLSVKASTAAIHSGYSVFYSLDVVSFNSSSRFLTHVAGKKKAHDCAPF
ncbi:MAG: hypothetical protein VXX72_10655, partial [Pseudomonadota bacterium]|nr:hypothetical protein [Pseudomonadota bacterium]